MIDKETWLAARRNGRKALAPHIKDGEIFLYDEIGLGGIGALEFVHKLQDLGDVTVRINSPGGDVFEGFAIYNALAEHPYQVDVSVDGMALSVASAIAMAGERREIAENALMMIHDPWTIVMGNAQELRQEADVLDLVSAGLVRAYRSRTDVEDIEGMMREETWMDANAAEVIFGFGVKEPLQIAAKFDLGKFKHAPQEAVDRTKVGIPRSKYSAVMATLRA